MKYKPITDEELARFGVQTVEELAEVVFVKQRPRSYVEAAQLLSRHVLAAQEAARSTPARILMGAAAAELDRLGIDIQTEAQRKDLITDAVEGETPGPVGLLRQVIEFGNNKHGDVGGWKKRTVVSHIAAALRHAARYAAGERHDEESALHPLAHAACRLLFVVWLEQPVNRARARLAREAP